MTYGFKFVDGERARRLDELTKNPPPTPKGVTIRAVPRSRLWEVVDENGRVLALWATKRKAQQDAERYQKAERGEKR